VALDEDAERELEALVRQRRAAEARLNRALGELLGSGTSSAETLEAIEEMEGLLRSIAGFVARQL
jgi:hypothetical protein